MKKVLLMAYVRKNLGDDLYIKMITTKYSNFLFFLRVQENEYIDELSKIPNLHIEICKNLKNELYNSNIQEFDACVYIGGSIFIEPKNKPLYFNDFDKFLIKCKKNNIPFYYISCNFGPYYTSKYLEYSRILFSHCSDICFRDKYSYQLFKDISTVRYAPDFVLNYNLPPHSIVTNSIGISVVNLENRDLSKYQDTYLKVLVNNINDYINIGKKVYLFSFCKYEGDEKAIDKIVNCLKNKDNVYIVKYSGNLEEFIDVYSQMEYFICTRFHSFILSSMLKQKSYLLSYSSKMNNVAFDLDLDLPIINIENLTRDSKLNLRDFKIAEEENLNKAIVKSKEQEKGIITL